MPEEVVQNPGQGGAGEATEPTEPQEPSTPQEGTAPTEPSGDPLDAIQDEAARAEAKKHRAIARRVEKDGKPAEPHTPAPAPSQPTAVAKLVTFNAKQLVSDEVKENWDALMSIPLGGYDASDPESIAQNMTKRLAILKAEPQRQNPTKDLTTSSVTTGRAGTAPTAETKPAFPRLLDVDAQAERLYGKS